MKYNTRVSICIPVYGVEQYIGRCAESLFKQTYDNIEYVFVNDCTNDRSIEILKSIILNYPQRKTDIHIINHPYNRGLAAARNTAIEACTGEFIMHVDSDDYLDINAIELAMKEQSISNADIVSFGTFNEYIGKTLVSSPNMYENSKQFCLDILSRNISVNIWGRIFRKNLYINNNIKAHEGVNLGEDYQIVPQLAYYATKISFVSTPLYHYNLTNLNSYTHKISKRNILDLQETIEILRLFFSDKGKEYKDALDKGEYEILINRLKNTSQVNELKPFFIQACQRIKEIPIKNKKNINIFYKIIDIFPYYTFVRFYVKIIRILRPNPIMK